MRFLPFQADAAKAALPELAALSCMDAMRFVDDQGRITSGVDAFRSLLPLLPLGRPLSRLFQIPGFARWAYWAYRHLAKNRYRWFGKRSF